MSETAEERDVGVPRYTTGTQRGRFHAHFPSGRTLEVATSRQRGYPGLPSQAPATLGVYSAISQALNADNVAWDVGCGAGGGTALLGLRCKRAIGFDSDDTALDFARSWRNSSHRKYSPRSLSEADAPDLITVVDVLGQLQNPDDLLWELRQHAKDDTSLVVAEPRGHVAQTPLFPCRTTYSCSSLERQLRLAGWHSLGEVDNETDFIVIVAQPGPTEAIRDLRRAVQLPTSEALPQLATVAESSERSDLRVAAHLALAERSLQAGDGDGASRHYLAALDVSPEDPDALAALSQLTLLANAAEEAVELAGRALTAEPTNAEGAVALALAGDHLSEQEGHRAWQVATALAPANPAALSRVAHLSAQQGNTDLAIAALEQLRSYHPDLTVDFHVTLAWLLLKGGRRAEARLEAKVASLMSTGDPQLSELWEALNHN